MACLDKMHDTPVWSSFVESIAFFFFSGWEIFLRDEVNHKKYYFLLSSPNRNVHFSSENNFAFHRIQKQDLIVHGTRTSRRG